MRHLTESTPRRPDPWNDALQLDGHQAARAVHDEEVNRRFVELAVSVVDAPRRRHDLPGHEHLPVTADLDAVAQPEPCETVLKLPLGKCHRNQATLRFVQIVLRIVPPEVTGVTEVPVTTWNLHQAVDRRRPLPTSAREGQ